jgi:hypothetical protein
MLGIGATVFGIVAVAWPRHEGNAQRMATGQFRRPA